MTEPSALPKFNTDVLWKPPRLGTRIRTVSMDSSDSVPVEAPPPAQRRFSISGMFFGPSVRQTSVASDTASATSTTITPERRGSITENYDFKEFLKRSRRLVDDH
ncbi:Protein M01H9.3 b [Aphelenchoides avenae]|nr:Protein M01H9.3 b [Aphelenchus avenae]